MSSRTQYLQRRGNNWLVVVEIPKRLRQVAGRARFVRSLQTGDLRQANRLKLSHVIEFHQKIDVLGTQPTLADSRPTSLPTPALPPPPNNEIERVSDRWLNELTTDPNGPAGQTIVQHRAAVAQYVRWAGQSSTLEETDRRKAGGYVEHMLGQSGLSRRTIKRHLSTLSGMWKWQASRAIFDAANPWLGHQIGRVQPTKVRAQFTDDEVRVLLRGRYHDHSGDIYGRVLFDLIRLALITGARLEELCALRKADVESREDGYWLTIREGKTDSATRSIPLHRAGNGIVERRLRGNDENLFAGLTPGGPDNKRSWYVSKAFGRFRRNMGLGAPGKDFHALRNTFMEVMEGAEVAESTVKLLVGHKRHSLTFGHYSKGTRVALREAINRLEYPTDIFTLIRKPAPAQKGLRR